MQLFLFVRLIFIVLSIASFTLIFPIATAVLYGEFSALPGFIIPFVLTPAIGAALFFAGRKSKIKFSTRSVFSFVAIVWACVSLWGALPLIITKSAPNFIDAFFESVSGFTTTGATIFNDVESLPRSINLWRCQTHWLGGMGIIALTVAMLPLLGTGGFQLVKSESTGPDKGKITPKMTDTAKTLWFLYIGFTAAQLITLKIAGVSFFDSVCLAFSTLGTGGFSVLNSSVAGYNSAAVEIICTVFMFLAGVNFSLYYYLVSGKFDEIRKNSELKAYISIFAVCAVMIAIFLFPHCKSIAKALRLSAFQVASIMTTTGFYSADYMTWPSTAQFFVFSLLLVGGSSGSTAGGFKVIRWVILQKQARNEMMRMLHPHGLFSISVDGRPGRKDLVFNVAAFTFVYFALVFVSTLISTIFNLDLFTGFTASLSMVANAGPAFGTIGATGSFAALHPALKLWYCFVMIAGRLELYNLIIFIFPEYWRK